MSTEDIEKILKQSALDKTASLSVLQQQKLVNRLLRLKAKTKAVKICHTLVQRRLLTNCSAVQVTKLFAAANATEGMLLLISNTPDLPEAAVVHMLKYAVSLQSDDASDVANSDSETLLCRLIRCPITPGELRRELYIFTIDDALKLLQALNDMALKILASDPNSKEFPSISQIITFSNCLLDVFANEMNTNTEFRQEIEQCWQISECWLKWLKINRDVDQCVQMNKALNQSGRMHRDYSIEMLVFQRPLNAE